MITHIVSDWLFSPCCVEHQDEFIFERVAVAYSRDYNEVGRAQIKYVLLQLLGRNKCLFSLSDSFLKYFSWNYFSCGPFFTKALRGHFLLINTLLYVYRNKKCQYCP